MAQRTGWQAFKIGWRTIKTVLAVGITLLLFEWWHREPAAIAALAAVYAMQQTTQHSFKYGKFRLLGNSIGVIIAISMEYLGMQLHLSDHGTFRIISGMLGVLLLIVACNAFNISTSVINATATYFVVLLTVPTSDLFVYGFNRLLDTFIGISIAITVNHLLPSPSPTSPQKKT